MHTISPICPSNLLNIIINLKVVHNFCIYLAVNRLSAGQKSNLCLGIPKLIKVLCTLVDKETRRGASYQYNNNSNSLYIL